MNIVVRVAIPLAVALSILPAVAEARGFGGGFHGAGGGGGFSMGYPMNDRGGGVSMGYPMNDRGGGVSMGDPMNDRGGGVSMGYPMGDHQDYGGMRGGFNRFGHSEGGFGGYGGTAGSTMGGYRQPAVSEAERKAAADQSYNWGFDKAAGVSSGAVSARGQHDTAANLVDHAALVRNHYNNWNTFYGRDWWRRYPNAWWVPGWDYGYGWSWASWDDVVGLMGLASLSSSNYYDFGGSITINNNQVYYGNQPVATTAQYYQQAQTLAQTGKTNDVANASNWKSLGVYALAKGNAGDSSATVQLALDKNGDVAGNFYDQLTGQVLPVKGRVDKKNQRVAWTIGSNTSVVYDTGLGNLLSNQAPLLVHNGQNSTSQWMMVRLQRPATN